MTQYETKLLEIAKEIISLNSEIGAALTGSLLLCHLGKPKMREAKDIDIIVDYLCEDCSGLPQMPEGWKILDMEGRRSQVDAIRFEKDGIVIDFIQSEEKRQEINGIMCGSFEKMIDAKIKYSKNDKSGESRIKHADDLNYLKTLN